MRILNFIRTGEFLYNRKLAYALWFGLSLIALIRILAAGEINIYLIYKYSFFHIQEHKNLYPFYPAEYGDQFMYGPLFALLIAPFALLPDKLSVVLWVALNVGMLFWAIRRLPMHRAWKTAILLFCSHELMNHSAWLQVNALVCSFILLGFSFILEGKEGRAAFLLMLGTFIKLYGLVGFAFFFFSRRKGALIGWALLWSIVFFFAPLLLTSFDFLVQTYNDWFLALKVKDAHNTDLANGYLFQDISAMGMIRRIFGFAALRNSWVMIPGGLLFLTQYAPFRHWGDLRYRLYLLCSVLLSTVIFSSGAESPTYIIALPAICIWWCLQPKTKLVNGFFLFALFLTTFAYSDLFTPWLRNNVLRPYSLKALPSVITWVIILVQIHRRQFLRALDPLSGPHRLSTVSTAA
ncbi:glycosyltransferase family 87 protein [Flaviaesturariibacter terrae]